MLVEAIFNEFLLFSILKISMRKFILSLLLLFISQFVFAQSSDTTWFTKTWEKTTKENGYYYRTVTSDAQGGLLHVKDFFASGELQMEGYYTSLDPEMKEGTFIWWHKNGVKQRECLFQNNAMVKLTEWDENGSQTAHKEVVNVVTYVDGKPVYEPKYLEAAPRYAGKEGFFEYLKANVKYPAEAVRAGIGGKVIIGFVVTKKGKIKHVEVVQGVHPAIDSEALRVIKEMPRWTPALQDGKPVDTNMNLPISFNLK